MKDSDTIIRIYKNIAGKTIGIHCIHIHIYNSGHASSTPQQQVNSKYARSVRATANLTKYFIDMSNPINRTISTVTVIGEFDAAEYQVGNIDINNVTYLKNNPLENDIVVDLTIYPRVGHVL